MNIIENDEETASDARFKAKSFKEALLKYETILTAFTYVYIFNETTPLSNYLQTNGFDILKAYNLVESTTKKLEDQRKNFNKVIEKADDFISWCNKQFDENQAEIEVESKLPEKRIRKKKRMPGELASDEVINNPVKSFEVKVFNVILDKATTSLKTRFDFTNNTLYADLANLDPKNFSDIRSQGLNPSAFRELSKKLLTFDDRATEENLRSEIIHLANAWNDIKRSNLDEYYYK